MGFHTQKLYLSKTNGQIGRNHSQQLYHQILKKNIATTHVADKIDWENKSVTGQTHNTNSILIQHINDSKARNSSILLEPDYEFDRKQHRSYKGKSIELPHFTGEKKCNTTLKAFDSSKERDNNEFTKSLLTNRLWAKCRFKNEISEAVVPSWSSFHKQTCVASAKKAIVGYLPAVTDSPTKYNVVQCIMQRTIECMSCLNLNSIFLEVDQAICNKVFQCYLQIKRKKTESLINL